MISARNFSALFCACLLSCVAVAAPLVTGNGFGFAVVPANTATLSKFYAHPYSFSKPDAQNPLSEGIETTNFIRSLGWNDEAAHDASAEYMEDSHIITARNSDGEGFFFMPFGLRQTALIVSWSPTTASAGRGGLRAEWSHALKSQRVLRLFGSEMRLLKFENIDESLLLIPLARRTGVPVQAQEYLSTSDAWALISVESDSELKRTAREFINWRAGLTPKELAKRELAEVERWRVHPAIHFNGDEERHLWRQSEIVLRMAQSREPNRPGRYNNGLIVAALPDGSWFMPWTRDMAYAAVALARMGHRDEARAAVLAYLNARPTGKLKHDTSDVDYQVSLVRYFGDGSEEPFFTNEGSTNVEFDSWGLALWVIGEYTQRYDDTPLLRVSTYRGRAYESIRDFVVKPLLQNLEAYGDGEIVAADTSIWEERQKDKKHFAFSTGAAIVGLQEFAQLARRAGDERSRADALQHLARLEKGFRSAFIRQGTLRGTLEDGVKNDIDGALLALINFGLVADPAVVRSTVDRMELLKVASGGYRRVRSNYTDPSIYEYWYERQEFLFVDFSLAEIYRRLGRNDEADSILRRIVAKSAKDHNFIPEMYVSENCQLFPGELGDPTGAVPMVGYGAGAYILHVLR